MGFLLFKDTYFKVVLGMLFFIYIYLYFLSLKYFPQKILICPFIKITILLPNQGDTMPKVFKICFSLSSHRIGKYGWGICALHKGTWMKDVVVALQLALAVLQCAWETPLPRGAAFS